MFGPETEWREARPRPAVPNGRPRRPTRRPPPRRAGGRPPDGVAGAAGQDPSQRRWQTISEIGDRCISATVAREDARFWIHDIWRMKRTKRSSIVGTRKTECRDLTILTDRDRLEGYLDTAEMKEGLLAETLASCSRTWASRRSDPRGAGGRWWRWPRNGSPVRACSWRADGGRGGAGRHAGVPQDARREPGAGRQRQRTGDYREIRAFDNIKAKEHIATYHPPV